LHSRIHALALIVAVAFGPRASVGADETARQPTHRTFGGMVSSSHYVTMRDGVRLAVDVHLPKGLAAGERTATVLHMSRYYRSVDVRGLWKPVLGFGIYPITDRDVREPMVKAGYSWVDVDVRGAGASFGHHDYPLSPEEVRDGADLIDWIVDQPWSAGVVGAIGSSYDGSLATMLARNHHPALKAIVPRFSGWDMYGDVFFPGGLQATSLLRDWAKLTSALDRGRLTDVFGWTGGVVARGVRPVDSRLLPDAIAEHSRNVDIVRLLGSLTYRDDTDVRGARVTIDDFSPHAFATEVDSLPIYAYGGWFDGALARSEVHQYLTSRHPGSRLRLGPWFHAGEFNASPYADGESRDFDHAQELIRFFDVHLRGADDGFGAEEPVQYYTMGEERWKSAPTWPPPGAVSRSFFLNGDASLDRRASTAADERHDRYEVDTAVSSGPGSRWGLIVGTGARRGYGDQRERDSRLLTYTTPPLQEALEVTGHPVVRLFLSANANDAAVFAYLEDVSPGGDVRYVTEGHLRLIHRDLSASPLAGDPVPFRSYRRDDTRPLVPGDVSEIVFDLLPTSFVFRVGHAIRLAIAGADAGTFDTPLPVSPLIYEIHRDRDHASRLELPTYRGAGGPLKHAVTPTCGKGGSKTCGRSSD
jgi:putative CocE/NonD family hydrolase